MEIRYIFYRAKGRLSWNRRMKYRRWRQKLLMWLGRPFALFLKMVNVTITARYLLLEREAARQGEESDTPGSTIAELIKWSYADSPYCCYEDEDLDDVKQLFMERPSIAELEADEWNREFDSRLKAMELAMKMLDDEGVFALNQPRESVCVLVENMPPDEINTEIALRLNRAESPAMQAWLAEAAE